MVNSMIKFSIGDRVTKISDCYYSHAGDNSGVSINEVGTIVRIRSRYVGTHNEYHLYIVKFDNHTFDENELNNQYTDDSIKLI